MPAVLDQITAALRGLGLSNNQIAGVEGNLQVESGFNPAAYNQKEGAIGLAQWEGGRRSGLQQFAAAHGTSETDLGTQIGYLRYELQGPEGQALSALRGTQTPAQAALVFDKIYERSSGSAEQARMAAADEIAGNGLEAVLTDPGQAVSSAVGAGEQSAGSLLGLSGWAGSALGIGIRVTAAVAAAGLIIVGAVHTVSE